MSAKLSKNELIKEIIHCGRDPVHFIRNYAKIQHPTKGLIPFDLYLYQEDIVKGFLSHRKNVILKARQVGVTTITAAYISWLILFHRDKDVLIVSTKLDTSKGVIRIIRNIFKYIPKWMIDVGRIKLDNRHSIELENGSRVTSVSKSKDVGRSSALSLLVVDECAIIEDFDEIWTGLSPTVSTGGSIVLMSSPKGTGNEFHKIYESAKLGENGFNCKFGTYTNPRNPNEVYDDRFMWWVRPDYDEVWFATETRDKSPRDIAQEYNCNFNASGDTFIYHEDIAKLETFVSEPKRFFNTDRNVWIWEEPQKVGTYLIPCDVSRGDSRDYSAFHVLRLDVCPIRQVAEYKGKIRPDQLGTLLISVSQFYNNATLAPENNSGWSGQTILKIEEAQHPFLYYSRRRKSKEKDATPVDPYYAATRNDYLPGYSVTSANRLPMLAKLEQYVRMGDIEIHSPRLLEEFKTFIITDDNRPEAMRGYNDDLVMAMAGGFWVREEGFMYTYRSDEMTKAMINGLSVSNGKTKNFSDFNFNQAGIHSRGRVVEHMQEQNKIRLADGSEMDLNWLLTSG